MLNKGGEKTGEDSYTGSMTFDLDSGTVLTHGQELKVSTIATDTRAKDKEPDVLIMKQIFIGD